MKDERRFIEAADYCGKKQRKYRAKQYAWNCLYAGFRMFDVGDDCGCATR